MNKIYLLQQKLRGLGLINNQIDYIKYDEVFDNYRVYDNRKNFIFRITHELYDEIMKELSISYHRKEQEIFNKG